MGDQHLQNGVNNPGSILRRTVRVRRTRKALQFMCQRDAPPQPPIHEAHHQRDRDDPTPVGPHLAQLSLRGLDKLHVLHEVASPRRQASQQEDKVDGILHRASGVWQGDHAGMVDGQDVRRAGAACHQLRFCDGQVQQRYDVQVPSVLIGKP